MESNADGVSRGSRSEASTSASISGVQTMEHMTELPTSEKKQDDKFNVVCSFCRQNITQESGLYLVSDAVYNSVYGWLCHYCAVGLVDHPEHDVDHNADWQNDFRREA
jgi:hypothetical protein